MEAEHVFFTLCSPHQPPTPSSACSCSFPWPAGQSELSNLVLAHLLSLFVSSSRVLTSFLTCYMGLVVLFPTYLCPCSSPIILHIVADQALLNLALAHFSCLGFPGGSAGKESTCRRCGFDPWVRKIPCRRAWQPTPVFSPGESHGQRTWWATVDRVANSQTQLKPLSTHIHIHTHTHNGILLNLQKKHCHLQQHVWTYRLSY